jgi:serine/threonine-protein kinase RsbW
VVHGNQGQADKTVRLDLQLGRVWIRLQITDQGKGFDWREAAEAGVPDGVAARGRGLAICASYARRVAFNQPGNQITLWLAKPRKDQ